MPARIDDRRIMSADGNIEELIIYNNGNKLFTFANII